MKDIPIHPISELFPDLSPEDFSNLIKSIREHGLQHPITTFEGKILDGRNRYKACKLAGVEPRFVQYKGGDALGFAISTNVDRRHLSASQRALIAAKIADLKQGEAGRQVANLRPGESLPKNVTHSDAAERLNVSRRLVDTASRVLDEAPKSAVKEVAKGNLSLHAAEKIVMEKKAKEEVVLDCTGWPVPESLTPVWSRRNEVLKMMKAIASIQGALEEAKAQEDPLFTQNVYKDVISQLRNAHQELFASQIYAVCSTCQGRGRKSCAHCKGRGFLSRQQWQLVPSEIKAIREKV